MRWHHDPGIRRILHGAGSFTFLFSYHADCTKTNADVPAKERGQAARMLR